jgi:hypothetical protein
MSCSTRPAQVELVRGSEVIVFGTVAREGAPDLATVDRLLRLQLAVAAYGWTVRLSWVDPALRGMLELAGAVATSMTEPNPGTSQASRYGGNPKEANSSGMR